jgi:cytochrome c oxidase subunit 1
MLVTSFLIIMTFPVLTAALAMVYADRHLGAHFFDLAGGGAPILWQHLFWFFGHPEVYILILPYFGVITDVIPTFSRKPVFGYKGMVLATLAIAGLSVGVWAHHMFATGAVLLPFFSALSLLIAVPTGIKFFNWIGTMWRGKLTFEAPMLFAVGFLLMFLLGGLTGVMLAQPPVDFHVTDTYFVVAHMHYVLFGGSVFAVFAAIYYWFPKFTGRRLNEKLARVHFALMFVGFNLTFFPQHELGLRGMPRRIATYTGDQHWSFLNLLSSTGAYILGVAMLPFLWNVWISWRRGEPAGPNPWGAGTLEWATSSPPPDHNFDSLPPIRSERPVWDAAHPEEGGVGAPPGARNGAP